MTAAFDDLVEAYLAELWEEIPWWATALGVDGFDDVLGEYSAESYERRVERYERWLGTFSALGDEELTPAERIDRDLALASLRGNLIAARFMGWKRNPAVYLAPGLQGVFGLFLHRLRPEAELAVSAAARLRAVPQVLEDGKRNLDPSLASKVFVERAVGMCNAGITYARSLVPMEVSDPADRERVAEAGEIAARAFEDFAEFLGKLAADATGDWAIGEEMYDEILREKEGLGYGTRELRERGRAAFAALDTEMGALARSIDGSDDWRALLETLNEDHPATPDEMRALYEEWTERARQYLIDRELVTLPEGERCLVEPSPHFQRPIFAVASYQSPPAFKPSRTGHFFVPYPPEGTPPDEVRKRLRTNSVHFIPAVSVHEAYPGHHWHLVRAQQNPRPLRKVLGSSYFTEGWALYTELMMREEGFFTDPRDELGQLNARIFRAARIVVDTSLHLGEMAFDEAVRFMMDNAAMSEPTARAEVGRYCTWPTQAPSYLTGSLEVERMRARWFAEGRGTLREFHDAICLEGMLPIALAERALFA